MTSITAVDIDMHDGAQDARPKANPRGSGGGGGDGEQRGKCRHHRTLGSGRRADIYVRIGAFALLDRMQ